MERDKVSETLSNEGQKGGKWGSCHEPLPVLTQKKGPYLLGARGWCVQGSFHKATEKAGCTHPNELQSAVKLEASQGRKSKGGEQTEHSKFLPTWPWRETLMVHSPLQSWTKSLCTSASSAIKIGPIRVWDVVWSMEGAQHGLSRCSANALWLCFVVFFSFFIFLLLGTEPRECWVTYSNLFILHFETKSLQFAQAQLKLVILPF